MVFHALIERKAFKSKKDFSIWKDTLPVKHCRPLVYSSTVEKALHMETPEKSSKTVMVTHLLYRSCKRLENWPKISEGKLKALRDFGDFLQACRDATLRVPSLKILGDCFENQKPLSKLQSFAAPRWNRQVQETIDSTVIIRHSPSLLTLL